MVTRKMKRSDAVKLALRLKEVLLHIRDLSAKIDGAEALPFSVFEKAIKEGSGTIVIEIQIDFDEEGDK
jgi:hypothetical protein